MDAVERIVGVHEERRGRVQVGERTKRFELAIVSLDVAVCHSPGDRYPKDLSCQDVARGVDTRDVERAGGFQPCVHAMHPAQPEVHDGPAGGGEDDARSL